MTAIRTGELPQAALLQKYRLREAYTDCYFTDVAVAVSQSEFVEAFYTTWLFRIERVILALFASRPSTDRQARQLACGEAAIFAAWNVEDRTANQLLLCDFLGRTRSWLMTVVEEGGNSSGTRLYFGSAVVPKVDPPSGRKSLGFAFNALLGFHRLYSRMLLKAALANLSRPSAPETGKTQV